MSLNILYIPRLTNPCLQSLPEGLTAYYKLDETSGTTVIDSLGNYDLTNIGITVNVPGKLGKCYSFPHDNTKYLYGPSPLAGLKEWTISLWVLMNNTGGYEQQSMIGGDAQFPCFSPILSKMTYQQLGGGYYSFGGGNFMAEAGSFTPDIWYLLTQRGYLTDQGQVMSRMSLNNIHRPNFSYTEYYDLTKIGSTIYVGKHAGYSFPGMDGLIDNIGIWNRLLTDCEIEAYYASGNGVELNV